MTAAGRGRLPGPELFAPESPHAPVPPAQAHSWEETPRFSASSADHVRNALRGKDGTRLPGPLVGLDIDGTLLGHDGSLRREVVDVVAALREAGAEIVLATGRSIPAVLPVAEWLGLTSGFAVCSNGAVTIRIDPGLPRGFELVDVVTFDPADAVRALVAEAPDVLVAVEELGEGFKVTQPFPAGELVAPTKVVGLEELLAEPVSRVTLRAPGRDSEHFIALVERVGLHGVSYAIGWTAWLDLTPPGVSKASALERVRRELGVASAATVAVGDGQNDREMLEWAALGVAMGSADAETIALADAVTGHVDDNGVVEVLSALL